MKRRGTEHKSKIVLLAMYLDYVNNFATLAAFADHYGIMVDEASIIIDKGRVVLARINAVTTMDDSPAYAEYYKVAEAMTMATSLRDADKGYFQDVDLNCVRESIETCMDKIREAEYHFEKTDPAIVDAKIIDAMALMAMYLVKRGNLKSLKKIIEK